MKACPECGFGGNGEARGTAVDRVADFPGKAARLLLGVSELSLRSRPAPKVWSPLEYAAHTGETVSWYHQRIRRALSERQPQFAPFDWDAACRDGRYRDRATARVLDDVDRSCSALAADLRELPPAAWKRGGVGSDGSPRSVDHLVRRAAHETVHHEHDIRAVLRQLKTAQPSTSSDERS